MIARREWYERTESTWPEVLPPLSGEEAIRAARKLYRFVRGKKLPTPCVETHGRRYSGFGIQRSLGTFGEPRRRVLLVNAERGWKNLVHELSHQFGGAHSKEHARLEARMIREVLKRGWLDGRLKSEPAPEPTAGDRDMKRLEQIDAGIQRWERKAKRAETALRKLRRRRKYYETKTSILTVDEVRDAR